MKKEVVLLIVIIFALSVYLVFHNADKVAYELPKLNAIAKKDITRIEIQKQNETLTVNKNGSSWHVGGKQYIADANKIDNILNAVESFALTAMVSEAKNYERYDLTDEKKIHVQVWQDGNLKLDFDMGKPAGTNRHTFVKMASDDRVYHARGNFRNTFDITTEALRDKQVMKFDTEAIHQVQLKNETQVLLLSLNPISPEVTMSDSVKKDTDLSEPAPDEKKPNHWKAEDGKDVDGAELDRLLSQLSDLRCQGFINDKAKADFTKAIYTIVLSGIEEYTLSIYDKGDVENKEYPAISSMSDDPFVLPQWQVEKIMVKFDELLKSPEKEAVNSTEK